MHRPTPGRLTDETESVWLVPTDDLDYVRESLEATKLVTGRPACTWAGRLVGYANLRPVGIAICGGTGGWFPE
ncbi:DUF6009 family protein [Streptomyces melanogenes]|uniref:DUF6009 family protein n=1 Tax=Streptomyces melanogenes TaxID=67326 RepID=A0ABZ1XSH0_9ACTN|nr:DUF6009 family protein [Streptomyces melanogenes]